MHFGLVAQCNVAQKLAKRTEPKRTSTRMLLRHLALAQSEDLPFQVLPMTVYNYKGCFKNIVLLLYVLLPSLPVPSSERRADNLLLSLPFV